MDNDRKLAKYILKFGKLDNIEFLSLIGNSILKISDPLILLYIIDELCRRKLINTVCFDIVVCILVRLSQTHLYEAYVMMLPLCINDSVLLAQLIKYIRIASERINMITLHRILSMISYINESDFTKLHNSDDIKLIDIIIDYKINNENIILFDGKKLLLIKINKDVKNTVQHIIDIGSLHIGSIELLQNDKYNVVTIQRVVDYVLLLFIEGLDNLAFEIFEKLNDEKNFKLFKD
jgi:hypothetical protein